VHKWAGKLRWDVIGRPPFNKDELRTRSIILAGGVKAFAAASKNKALMEGAHAQRIVYVYDESKAIKDDIFDATEGAFSTAGIDKDHEAYALAISTPGEPIGRFYDIHARKPGFEDWWVRHVTLEESIAAGRISRDWAERRAKQWGTENALYKNHVLGEFSSSELDGVIPLSWVELSNERWYEISKKKRMAVVKRIGVDVARGGGDKSAIAMCYEDLFIDELKYFNIDDTMELAGKVMGIVRSHSGATVIVDVIGLGAGVFDRIREIKGEEPELDFEVVPFNSGEKTDAKDKSGEIGFINKRAASWWMLREMLDPNSGDNIALPPDDQLLGELVTPKWKPTSNGRIQVEAKEDIRKRLEGRSTDAADAVIMALVSERISEGMSVDIVSVASIIKKLEEKKRANNK
jgi:hypothetical protein